MGCVKPVERRHRVEVEGYRSPPTEQRPLNDTLSDAFVMANQRNLEAHDAATGNQQSIKDSKMAGCFYCLAVYPASEVEQWVTRDQPPTARCPHCGVDSVLGDAAGFPLTREFLQSMYDEWFGTSFKWNPETQEYDIVATDEL